MKAKITRIRPEAILPEYKTAKAACFDLAPCISGEVPPQEMRLFPTGLVIQAPPGHMLLVAPRSSTFKKTGLRLANTVGIIDEDYCGPTDEIGLMLWNPSEHSITVKAGERIAQATFIPVTRVEWEEAEASGASRGGWGSTGS